MIHKKSKHFNFKATSDYEPPEYEYLPPSETDFHHNVYETINIKTNKGDPHAVRFHQPGKAYF